MEIKPENYITIPAWVMNNLDLKGNDLIVYCIIYGFTQVEGQWYKGSINYLQAWTNSTRQGIIKNLDKLVKSGLLLKEEHTPTNWYCANLDMVKEARIYKSNSVTEEVNKVTPVVNSVTENSKLSLHNNINNNIIKSNKYKEQLELTEITEEVISYFNNICKTSFKASTAETKRLIKARLKEGFTIDDLKKVIDCKYEAWGARPFKFKSGQMSNEYLRPSTLFSDKFESYIYEANCKESSEGYSQFNSISVKADDNDRIDITF